MRLKPKIGIDKLKFGMTQKDIFEKLGSHDRKRVDEDDDEQVLLEFYKLQLRLTIYTDEKGRLGYMRTRNANLTFNGYKVIGATIEFAKKEIFGELIKDWEVEEYDFFFTHSNDEFWLTLDEEYGIVTNVEIGVPFKNEEEYNWPD